MVVRESVVTSVAIYLLNMCSNGFIMYFNCSWQSCSHFLFVIYIKFLKLDTLHIINNDDTFLIFQLFYIIFMRRIWAVSASFINLMIARTVSLQTTVIFRMEKHLCCSFVQQWTTRRCTSSSTFVLESRSGLFDKNSIPLLLLLAPTSWVLWSSAKNPGLFVFGRSDLEIYGTYGKSSRSGRTG